jgi:ABC-2 type transport system permease protein
MKVPGRNIFQEIAYRAGLFVFYQKLYFRVLVEYTLDSWIGILSGMLILLSSLIFLGVTVNRIPHLAGWSFEQLLFLFGIAATGRGLNQVFLNAPFLFHGFIRRGTLDIMMVRPVGALFQMIGLSQELLGLGGAVFGVAIILHSAPHAGIVWHAGNVAYLIVAVVSSMLIQFAVLMIVVIPGFWVFEMRAVIYPVAWLIDFARFPVQIYHPFLRVLLTFVLPYALGSFYPAAYLIDPVRYWWALFAVPGTAIFLLFIAYRFWEFGLDHYSSAT